MLKNLRWQKDHYLNANYNCDSYGNFNYIGLDVHKKTTAYSINIVSQAKPKTPVESVIKKGS